MKIKDVARRLSGAKEISAVPLLNLTDEEMDCLAALASSIPPHARDEFVRLVASRLASYPGQARGVGLVHRLGVEAQRAFVNVAIGAGRKCGRVRSGR